MSAKLTVTFFIILCLEAGVVLTVLPWLHPFGMGDWGDNFFLLYAAQKTGLSGLQQTVSSGWVRGAVTGLGILNLLMAFWEMAHFRETVRALRAQTDAPPAAADTPPAVTAANETPAEDHAPRTAQAGDLSDLGRRDDARDHARE